MDLARYALVALLALPFLPATAVAESHGAVIGACARRPVPASAGYAEEGDGSWRR